MELESSPESLDDIRKKRLAYYESLSSGRSGDQNDRTETSEQKVQVSHTEQKQLFEEHKQQTVKHHGPSVPHLQGSGLSDKSQEIVSNGYFQERKDVPLQLKTSAFFFESPEDKVPNKTTDTTSIVQQPSSINVQKFDNDKVTVNNNTIIPGSDLDAYNETVERLIRATKEELLGMKSKDDIWEQLKSGTLPQTEKGSHQSGKVDERGDASRNVNMSPKILHYGYADRHRAVDTCDTRHIIAHDPHNLTEPVKPSNVSESIKEKPTVSENNNFNRFEYQPYYSSKEPSSFHHHTVQDQQKSLTSVKVEEIFSSRQMYRSYAPQDNFPVADSQEVPTDSGKVEPLRVSQGVSELGLSTHRPESDHGHKPVKSETDEDVDDINLGDTVSKELRHLLGEEKFQQFVMKAKRDIEDLHQERLSERSDGDQKKEKTPRLLRDKQNKVASSTKRQSVEISEGAVNERRTGEKSRSRKLSENETSNKKSLSDNEKINAPANKSEDFTPRISDGDAVHEMIGKYVLSKMGDDQSETIAVSGTQESYPDTALVKKPVPELNLSGLNKAESPRPRLNRPKHEPHTIYQEKKNVDRESSKSLADTRNSTGSKSNDTRNSTGSKSNDTRNSSKNYEQVVVPRNVCFSSSEIYSQAAAMDPAFASFQAGNVPLTPTMPSPHYGGDVRPSVSYGAPVYHMMQGSGPQTPTTPVGPHPMSQSTMFYNQYQPQYQPPHDDPNRRFFSPSSRQTSVTSDSVKSTGVQLSQANAASPYNQAYQSMPTFSGYYPPPPQQPLPPHTMAPHFPSNPQVILPHPPGPAENHHHLTQPTHTMAVPTNPPTAAQPGVPLGYTGYPYPVMLAPHPPPSTNNPVTLSTAASVPVHPPPPYHQHYHHHHQQQDQYKSAHGEETQPPVMSHSRESPLAQPEQVPLAQPEQDEEDFVTTIVETDVQSTDIADTQEKVTLVEESTFTSVSQIHVKEESLLPHPPASKKGKMTSPRRHPTLRSKPDASRHIEGIRQHHEQRRQEQEDKLSDEQILEKQRKFAKASIERYFSSLENIYRGPETQSEGTQELSQPIYEEGDDVEEVNDDDDDSPAVDKPSRDIIEDVFSTVDVHPIEAPVNVHKTVNEVADDRSQNKSKMIRFSDLPVERNQMTNPPAGHDAGTEVTTEVSIEAGGVTDRLNELGISVEHANCLSKNSSVEKKKGDKRGKLLIVCPECKSLNKEYMSWCSHCGEMIIGVEPMLVSKNREGKLRMKPVTREEANQLKNSSSSPHFIQDVEIEKVNTNMSVDVNYEQDIPDKPFVLNLDGIKSPEKGDGKKHISPLQSDGKDSGRPSSGDLEQEGQSVKIEQEVVDDICDSISDPVVKGYVKSHFAKNKPSSFDSKLVKERLKEDIVASIIPDTDTLQLIQAEMKTQDSKPMAHVAREEDAQNELAALELSQMGTVKDKIALFSKLPKDLKLHTNKYETRPEVDLELESVNTPLVSANDRFGEESQMDFSLAPRFSSQMPVQQNELALKLPVNSMDFSMDYSQAASSLAIDDSVNKSQVVGGKTEEELKAERRQERRRRRGHGAIDVEVFGYDESRESRHSSRTPHAIPTLNLAGSSSDSDDYDDDDRNISNSSDEESIVSDMKPEAQAEVKVSTDHRPEVRVNREHKTDVKVTTESQEQGAGSSAAWQTPHSHEGMAQMVSEDMSRYVNTPSDVLSPDIVIEQQGQTSPKMDESPEHWKLLFEPQLEQQDEVHVTESSESPDPEQPFLLHLINQAQGTKPKTSKGKPIKSKVRQSLEEGGYQRKWARSSTAWSSYNTGELKTRSSLDLRSSVDQSQGHSRPASASKSRIQVGVDDTQGEATSPRTNIVRKRPASAPRVRNHGNTLWTGCQEAEGVSQERPGTSQKARPVSASLYAGKKRKKKGKQYAQSDDLDLSIDLDLLVEHRLPRQGMMDRLQDHMASPQSTYDKYLEMTPRIQAGTVSVWQCLPDEILLHIFAYLDQSSLTMCAQVCHHFYRVAMDESLWKYITIKKKSDLDDTCLTEISRRHPYSLALIQCQGDRVSARGLRELFKECAETLKELNIARCSRGALSGDSLLLHAAVRCHNLTHIDTSWCNITDSGLMAISNSCNRLESLCINGCQAVTNDGLETVIKKHGSQLRVLELFGCSNISPRGLRCIANNCINLLTLSLGQCYKVTDSCISQLSTSLGRVETLDLRGCKQIKDNCLRRVVKNCPRLKNLSLANCPSITDVSALEISTYLTDIRSLDVAGCKNITDGSIRALVNTCKNLRHLDISSTGCTHRSVSMIANFANDRLESLKINFLSDVTEQCLLKLAKHCHRLKTVHMYGCPSVRNVDKLMGQHPGFSIEM